MQLLDNFIKIQKYSVSYREQGHIILISHFKKTKMFNIYVGTCHNQIRKCHTYTNYEKCTYLSTY